MGIISMIATQGMGIGAILFGERYVLNNYGADVLGPLDGSTTLVVPKLYGLVVLANLIAPSFMLQALASKVGAARKKYDVELPQLYATGNDESSKKFNCIQRGHQQALETFTTFVGCSLIGGIRHPIMTAVFGVVYCISRLKWAEGYSTGDPACRYTHSKWGRHIWTALIGVLVTSVSTSLGIMNIL